MPIVGFYLQPRSAAGCCRTRSGGGSPRFRRVVAIKIAPFNRYQTLDVVRAVAEAGRDDIALYTGNDDNIVLDLSRRSASTAGDADVDRRRIVGGLLGHWAVWTQTRGGTAAPNARPRACRARCDRRCFARGIEVTDANAAFFDAANGFAGCIAGIHEVLCAARACSKGPGASIRTKRSAPARPKRSRASITRIRI